jgi:hypothetical protein
MADLDRKFFTASIRGNIASGANYIVVRAYVRGAGITVTLQADGTYTTGGNAYLNYNVSVSGTNGTIVTPFREIALTPASLASHPDYGTADGSTVYVNRSLPLIVRDPKDNVYSNP